MTSRSLVNFDKWPERRNPLLKSRAMLICSFFIVLHATGIYIGRCYENNFCLRLSRVASGIHFNAINYVRLARLLSTLSPWIFVILWNSVFAALSNVTHLWNLVNCKTIVRENENDYVDVRRVRKQLYFLRLVETAHRGTIILRYRRLNIIYRSHSWSNLSRFIHRVHVHTVSLSVLAIIARLINRVVTIVTVTVQHRSFKPIILDSKIITII